MPHSRCINHTKTRIIPSIIIIIIIIAIIIIIIIMMIIIITSKLQIYFFYKICELLSRFTSTHYIHILKITDSSCSKYITFVIFFLFGIYTKNVQ